MHKNEQITMKKVFNAIWVFMALIILNPTANAQSEVCTDFDDDGVVGYSDFFLFRDAFNSMQGDANWNARFDLKADGVINFADFLQFAKYFGKGCEGQKYFKFTFSNWKPEEVTELVDYLCGKNDWKNN